MVNNKLIVVYVNIGNMPSLKAKEYITERRNDFVAQNSIFVGAIFIATRDTETRIETIDLS